MAEGLIGIAYPFRRGAFGAPASNEGDRTIRDSLEQIFGVGRFERLMRPGSGSAVYALLFESDGPFLRARIVEEAKRAVREQEPRIRLLQASASIAESEEGSRRVTISFTYERQGEVSREQVTIAPAPTA